MTLIMWDKPRQRVSKKDWKEEYGFEDGPTGGYQPNMSNDDAARWKGKITGTKLGFPQVEIRKAAGSLMTMIINLGDGYNYKYYKALPDDDRVERYREMAKGDTRGWCNSPADVDYFHITDRGTAGVNVHLSMNGPSTLTFEEMAELSLVVEEAKVTLEALIGPGERQPYVAYGVDAGVLSKEIEPIDGCKVRCELPALKAVGFTATNAGRDAVAAMPGVTVLTHEDAETKEKRAYNVRHGNPVDED